ncbi:MAG: BadF/BadG/BcrA/BcrD ATPase family protein [Bryobacteraceae bacterium]
MRRWLVGLDVGSTTVKAVAAQAGSARIEWRDYRRHEGQQALVVAEFLRRLERELGLAPDNAHIYMTGSGATVLAPVVGARYVQEVNAVALAAERHASSARSVIELGGQDAKMIFFEPQPNGALKKTATMNDQCAGGTGAVLDKLSAKLRILPERLREISYLGRTIHPVAGKCGVFAESDINGLQKQGVAAEDLMASLFDAIVVQNLAVLARGHLPEPAVLLLGGPNVFLKGLREAWRVHLERLWKSRGLQAPPGGDSILCPEDGVYFAALGALEFGREQEDGARYAGARAVELWAAGGVRTVQRGLPGLRGSDEELKAFLAEFGHQQAPIVPLREGRTERVFLGLDGGSTSTKAVLIDEEGQVRARAYRLSRGNPIEDVIALSTELLEEAERCGARLEVAGAATTGYAKDVLAKVIGADLALVETVAHARAGLAVAGEVDVIVDVGGQDIKLVELHRGQVRDFLLNTQCSAGNGYFLEATARAFGFDVTEYAARAFEAHRMPEFSYGCAVFLQADIVNFQRQGWTREEILAGLAAVLPKNIWLYVAKIANPARLGRRFLLQGGTQRNLAAVKAQVDYLRARFAETGTQPDIRVHPYTGEAGAIGAALEVRDRWLEGLRTRFPGLDAVRTIRYNSRTDEGTRCNFCSNRCLRTFIDVRIQDSENRIIVASCEKGSAMDIEAVRALKASEEAVRRDNPNLVALAAQTVWKPPAPPALVARPAPRLALTAPDRARACREQLRIGIPRVFYQYIYGGFFSAYLQSLGVRESNILWSDFTSERLYRAAAGRGAIDPCFPSKVVVAHFQNLLYPPRQRAKIDVLFSPMFDHLETHLEHVLGTHACPTVIAAPQSAAAAFHVHGDEFARLGVTFLRPLLNFRDHELLEKQMFEAWRDVLGLTREENARALEEGFRAQRAWAESMKAKAAEVLRRLEQERRLGIVLLGRPYHHDPGLNHGILDEFTRRGYPVFSQSFLPTDRETLERVFHGDHPLDIDDVWQHPYSASTTHKVWAAKFVARHPNLIGVELSNFRCGHDAPAYQLLERIFEAAGRPFFCFRDLDENRPAASIRLRIETIDYYLRQHRAELVGEVPVRSEGLFRAAMAAAGGRLSVIEERSVSPCSQCSSSCPNLKTAAIEPAN